MINRLEAARSRQQARLATEIGVRMSELFAVCPELCGFALDETHGVPLVPGGDAANLCVREIAIDRGRDGRRYAEICDEIVLRLGELLEECPDARDLLRGRTFARALH